MGKNNGRDISSPYAEYKKQPSQKKNPKFKQLSLPIVNLVNET